MNFIIGCGGVGSALIAPFALLRKPSDITLIDGDTLELKNLNRQMFSRDDIGRNKAEALGQRHGCAFVAEWFGKGKFPIRRNDTLLVLVDNMPARREALEECDAIGCQAIFAANEQYSSEAFFYQRNWRDTPKDPRVYYPELNTETGDDPRAASIGCTGEAQEQNVQLVSANFMAAALAQHLYVLWMMRAPTLDKATRERLPHKMAANLSRLENYIA